MDVTLASEDKLLINGLKSWALPSRKIGSRTYRGQCVVAEARHVQYQKESSVYGASGGIGGFAFRGTGMTLGRRGFTATSHRDVVQVVFRDQDGAEQVHELPSKSAATVGCVTRLDMVNGNLIGCTNLSGKGRLLKLMDASSFIAMPDFSKLDILLALVSLALVYNWRYYLTPKLLLWAAVAAVVPIRKAYLMVKSRRQRTELDNYMAEVVA